MQFHEGLRDREAQPRAALGLGELVLDLLKGPAQLLDVARGDADAGIADRDGHHGALDACRDGDLAALRRELDGIREQVDEHLLEGAPVGPQREGGRHVALNGNTALEGPRAHQPHHFVQRRIGLQCLAFEHHAAGLDLRHVEDVVDDIEQEQSAPVDVARILGVFLRAHGPEHFRQHHLGEADDGIERRSKLMRHVGEEFGL